VNLRLAALIPVLLLTLSVSPLTGCHGDTSGSAKVIEKTFQVKGKVISTDATHVVLDHDAVPGFMEAMTMPYKLKDPSVVSELHPGDIITARIVVQQDAAGYRVPELDNIVVIAQGRPDYKPAVQYNVPKAGEAVPDFKLINQDNRSIHLSQFKGKILLVTFIYTRCPVADYCPRMSQNFAEIDKFLASDPAAYARTHLLSISFDPKFDTPAVLTTYGRAYTGKNEKDSFLHWDFAVPPSEKELAKIATFFGVGMTPGENQTITHSLSTVVIGSDGRIVAWFPTNEWKPDDVVTLVKTHLQG
jgi:protein SCO1